MPLVDALCQPVSRQRLLGEWLGFVGLLGAGGLACFHWNAQPLIFFVAPLALLAVLRIGLAAAASGLALLVPLALWATVAGKGPLAQMAQPMAALSGFATGYLLLCIVAALAVRRLRAATEAKAQFLASMSHDIRTPMHGVLGFADLLRRDNLSPAQRSKVERIAESGQTMVSLLNDILDFSAMEAGRLRLEQAPVALADELRWVAALFQPRAAEKGLTLRCEIDRVVPAQIVGDGLRLRQVLLNLVGNAVKFTDRGSVVLSVHARRGLLGSEVVIEVADTGEGIAPEALARIFAPYDQGGRKGRAARGGAGLGLAITRQLVTLMDGRIDLTSRPGEGTRASVILPMREPAAAASPLAEPPQRYAVNQR